MLGMFYGACYSVSNFSILGLDKLNTSNVTTMASMFNSAGYNATTFNLDLSNWDTSKVTSMTDMFYNAGYNATTSFNLDLSNLNTSNVTSMRGMFNSAGYNTANISLNLSG